MATEIQSDINFNRFKEDKLKITSISNNDENNKIIFIFPAFKNPNKFLLPTYLYYLLLSFLLYLLTSMMYKECGAPPRSLPLNVIPKEVWIIIVRGANRDSRAERSS